MAGLNARYQGPVSFPPIELFLAHGGIVAAPKQFLQGQDIFPSIVPGPSVTIRISDPVPQEIVDAVQRNIQRILSEQKPETD